MKQLPITVTFVKKDGELVFNKSLDKYKLDLFVSNMDEGQCLDVTYEETADDHTRAQLAKVHACIDELSKYTGYTKDEIKRIIKHNSHLITDDGDYKSFADCTKDELSTAIESVIKLGDLVGFPLA